MDVVKGMMGIIAELNTWQSENPDAPEVVHLAINNYKSELNNSIVVIQKFPDTNCEVSY
ncbi:hypothetical protein [Paenibacillus sp. FSL K6-2859]|uniref:hypothetical protein n=1 Tax=Paenibacillus sp. FSL K6-2859 TaxID=2921482 RepID=UPI0030FA2D9D